MQLNLEKFYLLKTLSRNLPGAWRNCRDRYGPEGIVDDAEVKFRRESRSPKALLSLVENLSSSYTPVERLPRLPIEQVWCNGTEVAIRFKRFLPLRHLPALCRPAPGAFQNFLQSPAAIGTGVNPAAIWTSSDARYWTVR